MVVYKLAREKDEKVLGMAIGLILARNSKHFAVTH